MSRSIREPGASDHAETRPDVACYVYGILPEDVEISEDAIGIGDPPAKVGIIRHGEIAALVSDVAVDRPLGRAHDLVAHEQLLDAAAAEVPVLPLRFGAVMTTPEAVVEELLGPHHDSFAAALKQIEGRAQFVLKARYAEQPVLIEVLSENAEARQLRDRIRQLPEEVTRSERMRLGELITHIIAAKREADTQAVVERFEPVTAAAVVREPSHERDAAHVAFLVENDRWNDFERAVEELRADWGARVEVRLLGPMAPYDFVVS
ncbi:GvpL/GvpF family gas vesicle protein [Microbispora triticiradicis]|uniref:GvpL/GvpF family gas vesicle protein n=2 Tax=Microbispora TaxID=2005 RepID=A0ABY3M2N4_9ACTN|nr:MULTISPECIES: GvpL/GvpF family gas vesicle protein [Microbispora]TLP57755.1 GvpL/GvpF family gas vesicle protein [Microbispora fusca]TYB64649.1 GvpL/GvpF family gas vesicle protein [Microbispora tritici]